VTMATMNIKDPAVHSAAAELARRRGVSMTEAVRQALDAALATERGKKADLFAKVAEIQRRAALVDEPYLTDDEMYDDKGLPR